MVERIGAFGDDNRAGIERTLHRISAIRNRRGEVIGLTCRVGRAVRGTVAMVRDVIEQGKSILILGRPGVGKTTLLREAARVLADELGKRVVVVDTSNEIAGDGDVPHPGIGRARRMQVARPAEQHQVMIEAVENHMPEVIVIDEIGTELEAQAARTIAERGVQLVGTAHGRTLDNLLINPTLSDLVGGIQAVTLGDEEARRRGTQKTVLERKAPPTFDVLVEQEERHLIGIHMDVAVAVDGLLRGEAPQREMRERQPDGSIRRWVERGPRAARANGVGLPSRELPVQREETWQARPALRQGTGAIAGQRPQPPGGRRGANESSQTPLESAGGRWLDPELALGAALIESEKSVRPLNEQEAKRPSRSSASATSIRWVSIAAASNRRYASWVYRSSLAETSAMPTPCWCSKACTVCSRNESKWRSAREYRSTFCAAPASSGFAKRWPRCSAATWSRQRRAALRDR